MLLFLLILTGVGVFMMGLPLPPLLSFSGNLVCELFMTIFNIHFFTQVQTKVEGDYLGRVLSTIFTLAILFMPVAKGLMTWLPSVRVESFLLIGAGVILFSLLAQVVAKQLQSNEGKSAWKSIDWFQIKDKVILETFLRWVRTSANFEEVPWLSFGPKVPKLPSAWNNCVSGTFLTAEIF